MSKAASLLFSVTMRHLSSDGRTADSSFLPVEMHHLATKQIQSILRAVEKIAPTVAYPTEPEVRIQGPTGQFVARVKDGALHLVSWSSAHRSGPATSTEIIAAISGETPSADVAVRRAAPTRKQFRDKLTLAALGAAILLVNSFTVWILTRPPRPVAAKCRLLDPGPAERLLSQVAGFYETGKDAGDRRLEIRRDASAQRVKLGPGGVPKDTQSFTVQAAESAGRPVLVTSRKSVITVKDNVSIILYGDTYMRSVNQYRE